MIKELGLDISLVGSHGFKKGPVDPANHGECVQKLTEAIEMCAAAGYKRVITFTGMKAEGIDDEEAEKNCIACWKKVLPIAEKNKSHSLPGAFEFPGRQSSDERASRILWG